MEKLSSYDQQAKEFTEKNSLKIRITPYPDDMQKGPPWHGEMGGKYGARHGLRYRITIRHVGKPGRLAFDFWDSIHNRERLEIIDRFPAGPFLANQLEQIDKPTADLTRNAHAEAKEIARSAIKSGMNSKEANKAKLNAFRPSAYDVLACVSSESYCADTFRDWCAEFGYDQDSRKALATFKRCRKFARRINAFFSADELTQLREIQ